jgi:hypothetical protein
MFVEGKENIFVKKTGLSWQKSKVKLKQNNENIKDKLCDS